MNADFVAAVRAERERRLRLRDEGRAYHYWAERGDKRRPREEHWCDYCAGFFGVPHDLTHQPPTFCRFMGRYPGNRQCACIDCVVWEAALATTEGEAT